MGLKNLNFEPGLLKFLSLYLTSYIEHKKESFVVGGVGLSGYGDLETRLWTVNMDFGCSDLSISSVEHWLGFQYSGFNNSGA